MVRKQRPLHINLFPLAGRWHSIGGTPALALTPEHFFLCIALTGLAIKTGKLLHLHHFCAALADARHAGQRIGVGGALYRVGVMLSGVSGDAARVRECANGSRRGLRYRVPITCARCSGGGDKGAPCLAEEGADNVARVIVYADLHWTRPARPAHIVGHLSAP